MNKIKNCISIKPFRSSCKATVNVPGSKSISNRALILSVMCNAVVELKGLLESEDVDLMQEALKNLGIKIEKQDNVVKVYGSGGIIPNKCSSINVGNAGTIARFLTCLLAAQKNALYNMDGSEAMQKRPMLELLECLEEQGSEITYQKQYGHFPFTINASGFNKNKFSIDARKSGQNISGILMQCASIFNDSELSFTQGTVSFPFIEMTLKMIHSFSENNSFQYRVKDNKIKLNNCAYKNEKYIYNIEADATAASYFLTLPLVVGGEAEILGMKRNMLQGDIAYCSILESIGARISYFDNSISCQSLGSLTGGSFNFIDISDTFLSLAAISPLLSGGLEIFGIEHTRKQETDRVHAMARELTKLGQDVTEEVDRLIIKPDLNKLKDIAKGGICIETYHDHRFAMSFAILGCYDLFGNGRSWLKIKDPMCCTKTFPSFFDALNTAFADSHAK